MREIKINFLLQPLKIATDQRFLKQQLSFLKAVISSGGYLVNGDKIAEHFLADQLLYLCVN